MKTFLICCILTHLPYYALAAVTHYNETTDVNKVVCVYPISGTYSPLQRYNYYAILAFIIPFVMVAPGRRWLISGAAATIMIFASTTAIHAVVLACTTTRNRTAFDMDIVGSLTILVITIIFLLPFLNVSHALRTEKARPLIKAWGFLLVIGTICGLVSITRAYDTSYPCVDLNTNDTLKSPLPDRLTRPSNCTPTCFGSHQILRSPSELQVVDMSRLFGGAWYHSVCTLLGFGMVSCFLGLYACFSNVDLGDTATRKKLTKRSDVVRGVNAKAGMDIVMILVITSPVQALLVIVYAEIYFLRGSGLPSGEAPYAVGQWSCWVATAFVILTAFIESGEIEDDNPKSNESLDILPLSKIHSKTATPPPQSSLPNETSQSKSQTTPRSSDIEHHMTMPPKTYQSSLTTHDPAHSATVVT